jgi:hypothetical protein
MLSLSIISVLGVMDSVARWLSGFMLHLSSSVNLTLFYYHVFRKMF